MSKQKTRKNRKHGGDRIPSEEYCELSWEEKMKTEQHLLAAYQRELSSYRIQMNRQAFLLDQKRKQDYIT